MENLDVLKEFLEAIESQDIEKIKGCLHHEMLMINPIGSMNRENYLNFKKSLYRGFPDFRYHPVIKGRDNEFYVVKISMTGTHTGVFCDFPAGSREIINPTGIKVALPGQDMRYAFRDNKIYRIVAGNVRGGGIMSILRQIGARMPPRFVISIIIAVYAVLRKIKYFLEDS